MKKQVQLPGRLHISESENDLEAKILEFISTIGGGRVLFKYSATGKKYFNTIFKKSLGTITYFEEFADDECDCPFDIDWVFSIGGGRALDRSKIRAEKLGARLATMPTILAHDGLCSPVAVVDGISTGSIIPDEIFVNLDVLRKYSIAQIHAGVGDLVSNLFAITDWKRANREVGEPLDDLSIILASRAAKGIVSKLEMNLLTNTYPPNEYLYTSTFLRAYVENLLLSGVAMSIAGSSRPCSGAEHLLSHAIDHLYGPNEKAFHGTQVLVSTLFLEKKGKTDLISGNILGEGADSVLTCVLKGYGMPTTFSDIGLNDDQIDEILKIAPSTRNRYTVLNEWVDAHLDRAPNETAKITNLK